MSPDTAPWLRKRLIDVLLMGAVVVFLMVVELAGSRLHQKRWDWDIREISVLEDIVVISIMYIIIQYFFHWARRRRVVYDAAGVFSASRVDGEAAAERDRQCVRVVAAGFAIGLVLGLVGLGLDLVWKGWRIFAEKGVGELIAFPVFGAFVATVGTRLPGDPLLPWRRARFSVFSLMIVIAYVALILGILANTRQIGFLALDYHARGKAASRSAEFNRRLAHDWAIEGIVTKSNIESWNRQIDYDRALADKYARAEKQPWEPVEPDSPRPK